MDRAAVINGAPSWICRNPRERDRFLDLHEPLVVVNTRILVLVGACVLAGIPWLERPWALAPALLGIVFFGVIQRRYERFRRPELAVFWALIGGETMIALALYGAELGASPALMLMAWPVAGVAGRFHNRCVAVGTAYGMALVALVLWLDRAHIEGGPMAYLLPLATLVAVATVAAVHRNSDIRQRGSASVDPLTGLLNRTVLGTRLDEIAEQSQVTGAPVAVVVADLDNFKTVNDTHGHAAGDVVLREVANRIRRELRAYDLVYRLGGEEFVVLLLGQDERGAERLAEALRAAIAATPIAGIEVTASFGVAASEAGTPFVWEHVFAAADAALYDAKAAGRDRVHRASRERAAGR